MRSLLAGGLSAEGRQVAAMAALAVVILWGQIENEVLYSVDGVVYALVGKELTGKPLSQWVALTWDGAPFHAHPHLTPWLLGASMKIFGVSTASAIAPIALISTLTVLLTYRIGARLIDHRFGLLSATVLTLTPQFVKGGRNPMLEPALMFFVMLALFFHLRVADAARAWPTALAGLSVGLAFLAKGPPALLAVAVIVAFQGIARIVPEAFGTLRLPPRRLGAHLLGIVAVSVGVVAIVDAWHHAVAGQSFLAQYAGRQLTLTMIEGRGAATNDLGFYVWRFFRYWPWWPLVLLSIPWVLWKRDGRAAPALALGSLVTLGTYAGFTAMRHKAAWYVGIHYVGSSLLAALLLRDLISEHALRKYYATACLAVVAPVLLLSATFPSVFLGHPRPFERFLDAAASELPGTLAGQTLADCTSAAVWRGRFFLRFYLDAASADCSDRAAPFMLVDHRRHALEPGQRVVFSRHPFSIVERGPGQQPHPSPPRGRGQGEGPSHEHTESRPVRERN